MEVVGCMDMLQHGGEQGCEQRTEQEQGTKLKYYQMEFMAGCNHVWKDGRVCPTRRGQQLHYKNLDSRR